MYGALFLAIFGRNHLLDLMQTGTSLRDLNREIPLFSNCLLELLPQFVHK